LNKQERKKESFQHYSRAYQIDPSAPNLAVNIASLYGDFKDYKGGIEFCRRYLQSSGALKEENYFVFKTLGWLYAMDKQPHLTYSTYQNALTLHPNDEDLWADVVTNLDYSGGAVETVSATKEFLKRFPRSAHCEQFAARLKENNYQIDRQRIQQTAAIEATAAKKHDPLRDFVIFYNDDRTCVSESSIAIIKQGVRTIPQLFIDRLEDAGYRVMIAPHLVDALPEIGNDHPRGWTQLSTWHNVNGTFSSKHKWIVVGEKAVSINAGKEIVCPKLDDTVAHEFGHAFDYFLGNSARSTTDEDKESYKQFSHSQKFMVAYTADSAAIQDMVVQEKLRYFLQPGDGGKEELFAQLFACLYGGIPRPGSPEELLSRYFPSVLATMKEKMSSYRQDATPYGRNIKEYK
jgi:tetratricopeptide (TPR) repeat protein